MATATTAPTTARRPRTRSGRTADGATEPAELPALASPAMPALTTEDRTALYRFLVQMRAIETRGVTLYKQGKVPGSFYDGRGQEAISVGAAFALGPDDVICSPLIRDLGAHLVRGTDVTEILRHYMGRENGLSRGREGNVHFGDRSRGIVGMVSMLPDMMVVSVGLAMAFRMRHEQRVALSFFGDGATSRGDWHEAMNWAGLRREPVVFVCEANGLAYSTPSDHQFVVPPAERAAAYGVAATVVDGNDVEAVHAAVHVARQRALAGDGPTLIEARTMRMHGHGAHDDMRYVDPELVETWAKRDPLDRYEAIVGEHGVDTATVREAVAAELEQAVTAALASPLPALETAVSDVFCTGEPAALGAGNAPWSAFHEVAA